MPPYQYNPLSTPQTIRLLHLSPSPNPTTPLYGTFQPADLTSDNPSEFGALSYVWGEPSPSAGTIQIDDSDLPLPTTNLAAALRRFRLPSQPRFIWVDAICINQADVSERNTQVALMGDIYRVAKMTLAWLGHDDDAENALRKLVDIADMAPLFGEPPRGMPSITAGAPMGSVEDVEGLTGDVERFVTLAGESKMGLVVGNAWFGRLWIVQEAVLTRDVKVVLGEAEVGWSVLEAALTLVYRACCKMQMGVEGADMEKLERAVELLQERKRQRIYRRPEGLGITGTSGGPGLSNLRVVGGAGTTTFGLHSQMLDQLDNILQGTKDKQMLVMRDRSERFLDTIWGLRYRGCGDDRDRIYAARSFIPWDVPVKADVDYTRSVVQVYTAFSRELLNASIMNVLLRAGLWDRKSTGPAEDESPSWVCDFRLSKLVQGEGEPWHHPLRETDDEPINMFETPGIRWPDEDPTSLRVQIEGFVVDEIQVVHPPVSVAGASTEQALMFYCTCLCARLKAFRDAKHPGESWDAPLDIQQLTLFARVLGVDTDSFPGAVTFVALLAKQGREIIRDRFGQPGAWELGPGFVEQISPQDTDEVARQLPRLRLRAFFATRKGNVGHGPAMLAEGDMLVRFPGLLIPCAVRKVVDTDEYRLISGCFLYDEPDLIHAEVTWLTLI